MNTDMWGNSGVTTVNWGRLPHRLMWAGGRLIHPNYQEQGRLVLTGATFEVAQTPMTGVSNYNYVGPL